MTQIGTVTLLCRTGVHNKRYDMTLVYDDDDCWTVKTTFGRIEYFDGARVLPVLCKDFKSEDHARTFITKTAASKKSKGYTLSTDTLNTVAALRSLAEASAEKQAKAKQKNFSKHLAKATAMIAPAVPVWF